MASGASNGLMIPHDSQMDWLMCRLALFYLATTVQTRTTTFSIPNVLLPRDAILARCMLSSCVRPSVHHKPELYQNDWTNWAGFWHGDFLPPIPHCVIRKFGFLQKLRHFPLALCPKLRTLTQAAPGPGPAGQAVALWAAGQAVACGHAPPCASLWKNTYLFTTCICISV